MHMQGAHTWTHVWVHAYKHKVRKKCRTQESKLKDAGWPRSVHCERWGRIWLTLLLAGRWGNCLLSSPTDWNKQVQLHLLASHREVWPSLAATGKGEANWFSFSKRLNKLLIHSPSKQPGLPRLFIHSITQSFTHLCTQSRFQSIYCVPGSVLSPGNRRIIETFHAPSKGHSLVWQASTLIKCFIRNVLRYIAIDILCIRYDWKQIKRKSKSEKTSWQRWCEASWAET